MIVLKTVKDIREIVSEWRKEGLTVGLVPTMGYLHEGHESLVRRASEENDRVVVSIFVNPMQFGPNEDLVSYPRDLDNDRVVCERAGADVIFNPENKEMYFEDFSSYVDINGLSNELCGKSRPIHFRGVCTVVTKLFNIVTPDKAYFGEKDAQQLLIIRKIVRDLNMNVDIIGFPIVREEDGLAKSSRNTYLDDEERIAARVLNKSLRIANDVLESGERDSSKVKIIIREVISKEPLARIDYVEVVDLISMNKVDNISKSVLVAIAVFIGKTRLIDNFMFKM